jgi:type IV secretory pathway TraG/TraD family ATPase VirD4
MLGSMLVSKFQLDVMSRANIKPEDRQQYSLYVDEFQNFATESFSDIFSEARKYGLNLIIAHQYIGQVNPALMEAIL